MALRGAREHYRIADMRPRHFNATSRLCGLGTDVDSIIDDAAARTPRVIDDVGARLPAGFPIHVFDAITNGAAAATQRT